MEQVLSLTLAALLLVSSPLQAEDAAEKKAHAVFAKHCLQCHGEKKQKGKMRLDTLSRDFGNLIVASHWAEVMTQLNSGDMPPEDEPRPTADEIDAVVTWISDQISAGRAARMAKRGPVAIYRLSNAEYANTIYDLLGVRFDPNEPGVFNEDQRWHGFERIGSELALSPSHVERYLAAAETILKRAFPASEPPRHIDRRDAFDLALKGHERGAFAAKGLEDKVRVPWWPGFEAGHIHTGGGGLPVRVRIQLSGLTPNGGRAPHLMVWDVIQKRPIFDLDVVTPEDQPIVVEFVTMAKKMLLFNEVPGKIGDKVSNFRGSGFFLTTTDTRLLHPTAQKLTDDDGGVLFPLLLVDWLEIERPYVTDAERKRRQAFYPTKSDDPAEVRRCLHQFAERAWRRPVSDAEVARLLQVVTSEQQAGEPFRRAYLAALTAVLASKNFYYLVEGDDAPFAKKRSAESRLNAWELASRLSYFLWGALPDEELVAAARAGTLDEPKVLAAQLKRMLADPRIKRFNESFPRQWLQLHRIGMFPPDPRLYPSYDRWLEKSMALETQAYFGEVFAKNLSIREFLASDWTMLNSRLAQFYGLSQPPKSGIQSVSLKPENHRGGLLTQAGILSLTSDGQRHRPVHRGVWVSEAIFGKTPPPPPPNVDPLEPTPSDKPKATIREQLEAHTTHAACASCHRKIDPLGFAFDNYNAIGQWRTHEKARGKGVDPHVVASGILPDGRAFKNPDEFKQLLLADCDAFGVAFVEQLATFALRRVMTIDDHKAIKAIAAASEKDDYRLRTIIEQLVMSELFQQR